MLVFAVFKKVLVGVLVVYLSVTNTIAEHIGTFLGGSAREVVSTNVPSPTQDDGTHSHSLFPHVLLDHVEYQRAATIASTVTDDGIPTPLTEDTDLNEAITDALVNVYCQYTTDTYIRTTTGTGFFINHKGVILTNAHVAQFLLLENTDGIAGDVECTIRMGNPATPRYIAELLYISPLWVFENPEVIIDDAPRGTGERDYALLSIAKSVDGSPLPAHFPALPLNTELLPRSTEGSSVLTGGYPAESLMHDGAKANLLPLVATTQVHALYTFGSNYADLFAITESPVGEHGASGGPVMSEADKSVIGLIVTKGDPETEGERSLRALTLSYVDRTMHEETGFSLVQNMQGDIAYRGLIFKKAMAPFLADILKEELLKDE